MNTRRQSEAGLVIGYGSVGRVHAQVLASRCPRLAIVDQSSSALDRARKNLPGASFASSLEELEDAGWPWGQSIAAVATWGPSHADVVSGLIDLGVRRILCEKPMATSVAAATGMVALADREMVSFGVNLPRRHSGLVPALLKLGETLVLGEICSAIVDGGAACIATNGIHYLDLVCALYDELPTSVIGTARGEAINPRSPDLDYYEGTAIWSFASGREAIISFTNSSTVYDRLTLYYEHAVLSLLASEEVLVQTRDRVAFAEAPKRTRLGEASEVVFKGKPADIVGLRDSFDRAYDELEHGDRPVLPPSTAAEILGALIGALASGRDGRTVRLPIDPTSELGRQQWPIS